MLSTVSCNFDLTSPTQLTQKNRECSFCSGRERCSSPPLACSVYGRCSRPRRPTPCTLSQRWIDSAISGRTNRASPSSNRHHIIQVSPALCFVILAAGRCGVACGKSSSHRGSCCASRPRALQRHRNFDTLPSLILPPRLATALLAFSFSLVALLIRDAANAQRSSVPFSPSCAASTSSHTCTVRLRAGIA